MTLRTHYRRAAIAQRDYLQALARLDRIGQLLWNGRPLKRWKDAARRATDVANKRYLIFEVLRSEARERMLLDPREVKAQQEIARRFVEARRRWVS